MLEVIIPFFFLFVMFYMIYQYCRMVWYRNEVLTPLVEDYIEGDFPIHTKVTVAWFHEACLKRRFVKDIFAMTEEMYERMENDAQLKKEVEETDAPREFEDIVNKAMAINHRAYRWVFWWYKLCWSYTTMKIRVRAHALKIENEITDDDDHFNSTSHRHHHHSHRHA